MGYRKADVEQSRTRKTFVRLGWASFVALLVWGFWRDYQRNSDGLAVPIVIGMGLAALVFLAVLIRNRRADRHDK